MKCVEVMFIVRHISVCVCVCVLGGGGGAEAEGIIIACHLTFAWPKGQMSD